MDNYQIITLIIISASALYGGFRLIKTKDLFANTICGIQILAIIITFSGFQSLLQIGFHMLLLATFLAVIYSVYKTKHSVKKRAVLLSISIPLFVGYLFKALHLSGIDAINFFMIIPIIAFVMALVDRNTYKNELGFISILSAEALIRAIGIII